MPGHRRTHELFVVARTDEGIDGVGELTLRGVERYGVE